MNLYIEAVSDYLINEWNRIQQNNHGTQEARFIVESLSPEHTFILINKLEKHLLLVSQNSTVDCHFKVAKGLWDTWLKQPNVIRNSLINLMNIYGGVAQDGCLRWIDEEDKLTYYRNLTKDEGKDALVVVLIGLDHTSDQGGLADFHLINESKIWEALGSTYETWIEKLIDQIGLCESSESDRNAFNLAIATLFSTKPRNLLRLAEFFERIKSQIKSDVENLAEILIIFYQELPFWGLPPIIFTTKQVRSPSEIRDIIKSASSFISHQKFKSKSAQEKALKKIEDFLNNENFTLPKTFNNIAPYIDNNDYKNTIDAFIRCGDNSAALRLAQTDIFNILKILKSSVVKPKPQVSTNTRLQGSSIEIFLISILDALKKFSIENQEESEPWYLY